MSLLDPDVTSALRAWLSASTARAAFATAPVGSGLTTLVRSLVRETRTEAVWLTPSDASLADRLRDAGGSRVAPNGRRKVVIVDDFDAASVDKRIMTIVCAFAKVTRAPLLCLGHPARSAKAEFAAKWARFDFPRPSDEAVAASLGGGEAARDVATACRGDVRSAARALDFATRGASGSGSYRKDVFVDGLDSVETVLDKGPTTVEELLSACDADSVVVPMGVFENYLATLAKDEIGVAARVAESFSMADNVEEHIHAKQRWDLSYLYGATSTAGPGVELRRRRGRGVPRVEKFGSVWSKVQNGRAKAKNLEGVDRTRAAAGLQRMPATDMAFQRTAIADANSFGTDEDLLAACWPLDEKGVLALMRLQVGPAPAYKHARVKRLLNVVETT